MHYAGYNMKTTWRRERVLIRDIPKPKDNGSQIRNGTWQLISTIRTTVSRKTKWTACPLYQLMARLAAGPVFDEYDYSLSSVSSCNSHCQNIRIPSVTPLFRSFSPSLHPVYQPASQSNLKHETEASAEPRQPPASAPNGPGPGPSASTQPPLRCRAPGVI